MSSGASILPTSARSASLTSKGREALVAMRAQRQGVLDPWLSTLPAEEQRTLAEAAAILERLTRRMAAQSVSPAASLGCEQMPQVGARVGKKALPVPHHLQVIPIALLYTVFVEFQDGGAGEGGQHGE